VQRDGRSQQARGELLGLEVVAADINGRLIGQAEIEMQLQAAPADTGLRWLVRHRLIVAA
jgi:hypothetical protein